MTRIASKTYNTKLMLKTPINHWCFWHCKKMAFNFHKMNREVLCKYLYQTNEGEGQKI